MWTRRDRRPRTDGGHATAGGIVWVLALSVALTAAFGPLTMWLYRSKG